MSRVLVVEDEAAIAELISLNLRHAGYDVVVAADAAQAQAAVDGNRVWVWRVSGVLMHAPAIYH